MKNNDNEFMSVDCLSKTLDVSKTLARKIIIKLGGKKLGQRYFCTRDMLKKYLESDFDFKNSKNYDNNERKC